MAVCAAGKLPIVEAAWTIDDWDAGTQAVMCEVHARTIGYGRALADLLGDDHPYLAALIPHFHRIVQVPCPDLAPTEPPTIDDDTRAALDRFAVNAGLAVS